MAASSAFFSAFTGNPAVFPGISYFESVNGLTANSLHPSLQSSTSNFHRYTDRERNGAPSASSSQNPARPKLPSARQVVSSSDSWSTKVKAASSMAAVLVNSFDRLSLATTDTATAQAAAAEAVALARAALKAAQEAADFSRMQVVPSGSYVTGAHNVPMRDGQGVLGPNVSDIGELRDFKGPSRKVDGLEDHNSPLIDRVLEPNACDSGKVRKSRRSSRKVDGEGVDGHESRSKKQARSCSKRVAVAVAVAVAVEEVEKDELQSPVVSFEGLPTVSSQHQLVVRSKKRTERIQKRERAAEKLGRAKVREVTVSSKRPSGYQGSEQYLYNHVGRAKLLTAAEEVELSKCIQDLIKLEKLKAALEEQIGREANPQEWAMAAGIPIVELRARVRKGRESKNAMVMSNLRLVYSIAKKYSGRGVALEDLVSDGCKGLIRGTEKFDPCKGFKFSTYAHWWIRQAITRSITDQARTIRLPGHLYETLSRITKAREMLYDEYGRTPTSEEVAELVGISQQKYTTTMRSIRQPVSMDCSIGHEGEETLGEILADPTPEEETRTDIMTNQLLRVDLENVLHTLNPREQDVLRLRYGLDDGYQRTLEEVGHLFRVTRERIRQIETSALRKLRQPSRSKVLREYSVSAA